MYQYHLDTPSQTSVTSMQLEISKSTTDLRTEQLQWFGKLVFFLEKLKGIFAKLILGTQKILEFFFIWHEVTYGKWDYLHHIPICIRPFSLPERTLRGVSRVDFQFEGGCDVEMLGSDKTSHQKAWFWEIRTWTSSPSEKICHSINQNSLKLPLAPFCSAKTTHN